MEESERLLLLIERIYDAALDAELWPGVLEETAAFLEGCAANLYYQDTANHSAVLYYSWGQDPHYQRLYIDTFAALNPLYPAGAFLDVGRVYALADVMPLQEFRNTRMYREWVRPQGIFDVVMSNLERTATGAGAVAVQRRESDGLFDGQAKRRLQLLVPHIRRAVAIGRVIEFHKAGERALAKTVDGLAGAVLLVTSEGRITFSNEQASAMLAKGEILRASHGRLMALEPMADRELREAIAAASGGDALLGLKGIAILLAEQGQESHVAHVLSISSGKRRDTSNGEATAALFVRPVTSASPSALEVLATSFQLTPSELRVLAVILASGGIDDIVSRLGLSKATVKTHLNHLFAKTGTRRQSDLIRLAAGYASPFKQ